MSEIRLVIAVPTAGVVRMDFCASLLAAVVRMAAERIPSRPESAVVISFDTAMSSVIHGNRETLVMRAIKNENTHILFLDDDMAFNPVVVDLLFSRRHPIVAVNYLIKNEEKDSFLAVGLDGKRIPTLESSTGILPIAYTGFGVSLFEIEVFKKVPQPWFLPVWVPEVPCYTTEDNPFYQRAREAGFTVYLDQDASKMVSHLGGSSWSWRDYKPPQEKNNG